MITTPRSRQRGLSMIGWAAVLLIAVVLGTAAFRMVPAYLEYSTVHSAINNLMQDSKTAMMSPREVRDALSRRFTINQVDVIHVNDLDIRRDGNQLIVGLDYEVREPLFYNVSVVMTFQNEYVASAR